jgi:hypothetical protein
LCDLILDNTLKKDRVLDEVEKGREARLMRLQSGRRVAIVGTVLLLLNTLVDLSRALILSRPSLMMAKSVLVRLAAALPLITGWLLVLIGLNYISEEMRERHIHIALLLACTVYAIVYVGVYVMTLLYLHSILYYLPLLVFQGILMPVLFFRLGVAFDSPILKIAGASLSISTILSLLADYLFGTVQYFGLVSRTGPSLAAITYILVLLGLVLLKIPALTEQEMQTQEQDQRSLRDSKLGVASFRIACFSQYGTY